MGTDFDRLIREKRSELQNAFAAHKNAREAVLEAKRRFGELTRDAAAGFQLLESEEGRTATRFNAISEELAELHRRKYGDWHITWRGPRSSF